VLAGLLGDTLDVGVISDFAVPLKSGDVRVLAESGPEEIAELPEVPTYAEMGYPLSPSIFFGLVGPAGLPEDVISKWEDTLQQIVESDRFTEVASRLNANISYLGHEDFQASVVGDIKAMTATLDELGMLDE
jgi:tripartite-type tricarboxylate transporter receptor subunit TctC